ncbi:MAG: DUF4037 domain-containing protein [Terricaulis sp.]
MAALIRVPLFILAHPRNKVDACPKARHTSRMALTANQQAILDRAVAKLRGVPNIAAIVLGGSHARGRARVDSDIDIGLYYRDAARFDIAAIRAIAAELNDTPSPVVSGFGEWGRWVDGGAWLNIGGQRVDLLYRALDRVEATLADAQAGRYEIDHLQQPPFGFFGPTVLGEVAICQQLHDPHGEIERLKARVTPMPEPLAAAMVQNNLWAVEFGLHAFAPKFAQAGDAYGLGGCLARFANNLVLALFALNRVYLVNDKTALAEIDEFAQAPPSFSGRVWLMLGAIGHDAGDHQVSLETCRRLFADVKALAGGAYCPAWNLDAL